MEKLRKGWLILLACLLFLVGGTPGIAQDDDVSRSSFGLLKISDPESRSFQQDLRQARDAIAEERFDDALTFLGRLLTSDPEKGTDEQPVMAEDYFLVNHDGKVLTSIKTEALRLLDSIPAKALKQYELAYGAEAQALLDESIAQGNAEKLNEVMRRFFHTEAGYKACLALGRLNLELGRPTSAINYLKRLVGTPAAQKATEPDASVLLAAALYHAGQDEHARDVLVALKKRQPSFAVRGSASPSFATVDEATAWLAKLFGRRQAGVAATALQWTMFRGSPDRNAITSFAEPTSSARWRVPIANDINDERLIAEASRSYRQQGIPSLPSIHPLVVRNVVIMRGPDQLVAIDVASGKRVWEPAQEGAATRKAMSNYAPNAVQVRQAQVKQRVWDDAVLGQLASDGELVYYVEGLGDAAQYGTPAFTITRNTRERNPYIQPASNKLVAVSLKKEGSLVWESRGLDKDDPLFQAFYLGAPLVVNGRVYVIAEIRGELSLVALEAATGELKWKQQIGHVENFSVLGDPLRRISGASPSYADGVLVCPTIAGAVVAIDLASRRLLWGAEYTHEHRFARFDVTGRYPKYGDRWLDGTATIVDGKVILAPPDSSELHCLDLATGKPVWPAERREDWLFVAGVHEGTIVVVGKAQIVGINLKDGRRAWDDIDIDLPSGRGVLDKTYYYQPTASGKLLVIDVATGEIKQSFATSSPLGNLATYQDDIISISDECVAAYPRIDRLEKKIAEALARNPRDPWALARRGELLMHERKWSEALTVLRDAYAQPKRDSAVPGMLVETILALLEEDYAEHVALANEAEKLITDPVLNNRFHRVLALGREKQGDRLGAFDAFLSIEPNRGSQDEVSFRERLIDLDLRWQSRGDRWIAAHLATLYAGASETERREMDRLIVEEFARVSKNAPGALRTFGERYAFHPLANEAQLDLAKLLVASNNLLEAERLVQIRESSSDRHLAAPATLLAARIFRLSNRWPEALRRYERLGTEFASVEIEPGQTGKQKAEAAAKQFEYRQSLDGASRRFARGRTVVEPDTRNTIRNVGDPGRNFPLTMLQADTSGDPPPTVVFESTKNSLRVRDSAGHDLTLVSLSRNDTRRFYAGPGVAPLARLAGHLLVVSRGPELVAIDLLRGGRDPSELILWRQDVLDVSDSGDFRSLPAINVANPWTGTAFRSLTGDSNSRPLGMISPITANGMCYQKQKELFCVDPLTGDVQWQRSDLEPGCDLFGDDERLFVCEGNSDTADVYSMLDGSLLGRRKVATFEHRWSTSGGRVLSWSEDGKGLKLQLDDVWNQKNVWTELAPRGSRGWLPTPDEVAIFSLDGKFKVRSLTNDRVKFTTQLEPEKNLEQLYVLRSSTQYVVATALKLLNPIAGTNIIQPAPGPPQSPAFTGKIYVLDAATGKPAWAAPAAVSQMGLPLDQPLDQPVLLFLRNIIPRAGAGSQRMSSGMLAIDKRTGAVLFEDNEIPGDAKTYDMEAERGASVVRITIPAKSIRIRFTEDPAPPQPPVQNDSGFLAQAGSRSIFGGLFRAGERPQPNPRDPNFDFSDPNAGK
jgi:outer membrane protein assembly factor BamB